MSALPAGVVRRGLAALLVVLWARAALADPVPGPAGRLPGKLQLTNQPPSLSTRQPINFSRLIYRFNVRNLYLEGHSASDPRLGLKERNRVVRMQGSLKRLGRKWAPATMSHLTRVVAAELAALRLVLPQVLSPGELGQLQVWHRGADGQLSPRPAPPWLSSFLLTPVRSYSAEEAIDPLLGAATVSGATVADFARAAEGLFNAPALRRSGFGGEPWARIARTIQRYDTMPDVRWFDTVFFLEHNTGTVLSRFGGAGNDRQTLEKLLDARERSNTASDLMRHFRQIMRESAER